MRVDDAAAMIGCPYPAVEPDAGLESTRMELHWALCLPLDRPMLRVANALLSAAAASSSAGAAGGRLRNVHTMGMPQSHVEGGTAHCVQGSYDYYHYLQDRFDDNGWGCAYRSLQTLCSWFQIQSYSSAPVPSHRDIQSCLAGPGRYRPPRHRHSFQPSFLELNGIL